MMGLRLLGTMLFGSHFETISAFVTTIANAILLEPFVDHDAEYTALLEEKLFFFFCILF